MPARRRRERGLVGADRQVVATCVELQLSGDQVVGRPRRADGSRGRGRGAGPCCEAGGAQVVPVEGGPPRLADEDLGRQRAELDEAVEARLGQGVPPGLEGGVVGGAERPRVVRANGQDPVRVAQRAVEVVDGDPRRGALRADGEVVGSQGEGTVQGGRRPAVGLRVAGDRGALQQQPGQEGQLAGRRRGRRWPPRCGRWWPAWRRRRAGCRPGRQGGAGASSRPGRRGARPRRTAPTPGRARRPGRRRRPRSRPGRARRPRRRGPAAGGDGGPVCGAGSARPGRASGWTWRARRWPLGWGGGREGGDGCGRWARRRPAARGWPVVVGRDSGMSVPRPTTDSGD